MFGVIPIILQVTGLMAGAAWLYLFITDAVRKENEDDD